MYGQKYTRLDYNDEPEDVIIKYRGKKGRKIDYDPTKHYPNKDEAKLLRKIMAETGLNEDEVRSNRHYSELLSEAQKEGQKAKRSNPERWCHNIIKKACKETGLAKEHPKTIEAIDRILAERKAGSWGVYYHFRVAGHAPENAKVLLERYGKTYKK
jgi:hypothetical protein